MNSTMAALALDQQPVAPALGPPEAHGSEARGRADGCECGADGLGIDLAQQLADEQFLAHQRGSDS